MLLRDPMGGSTRAETLDHTLVVLGSADEVPPGYLLSASRLSLGAGEGDDVYLSGVGVAPGHVRLVYLDGQVTLLSASEEVRIDGVVVQQFPAELRPLQTLSLSPDTHLAYGPLGAQWPKPPVWEVAEPTPVDDAPIAEAPDAPKLVRAKRVPRTVKQQVVHSAQLSSVVLGVATVLVVAMVLINLMWGSREVVNPGEQAIDRAEQVLQDWVKRDPARFASVRIVRRSDGAISLTGFMDSEEAYRALADQVRQQVVSSGGNVRLDAVTRERLEGLIRDQIGRYPLVSTLEVSPEVIRLNISGIQTDAIDPPRLLADLSRLRDRVKPREMFIDLDLEPAQALAAEIAEELSRSPITREFQFAVGETGGSISGVVAPAAEAEARNLLENLKQIHGQRMPLTFDVKVDPKLNFSLV